VAGFENEGAQHVDCKDRQACEFTQRGDGQEAPRPFRDALVGDDFARHPHRAAECDQHKAGEH